MKEELQAVMRQDDIRRFLAANGMGSAKRDAIAGDASFRKYERLSLGGKNFILMDAPPPQEDVRPFMKVQKILLGLGYSAPELVAADADKGLLLIEDLGDDIYSRVLKISPERELEFYLEAVALIADLAGHDAAAGLPLYDEALYKKELALFTDWFLPAAVGKLSDKALDDFNAIWRQLLPVVIALPPVLTLRDYHADNLLWLPERNGIKRVGLLDFQDAVGGVAAYDIVSLLEDARRDVSADTVRKSIEHFLKLRPEIGRDDFMSAYAVLGAQRNLKIIGIFTRLCLRDGKPKYLSLLPRVWGHLENDVKHPLLHKLQLWLDEYAPASCRSATPLKGAA